MHEQMDLFSASYEKPRLPKHIRLIELFAGIGAQAKALEILGCDFEHWLTCEWSWQSITAYNAIHMGGKIADTGKKRLRIRKLTEDECMRLMGFEEADTKAMREAGLSKANIYHSAGDSIVTTVLVALLGSLIGADYETKIREWSDKLRKETL